MITFILLIVMFGAGLFLLTKPQPYQRAIVRVYERRAAAPEIIAFFTSDTFQFVVRMAGLLMMIVAVIAFVGELHNARAIRH